MDLISRWGVQHTEINMLVIIKILKGAKQLVKNVQVPTMVLIQVFDIRRMVDMMVFVCIHESLKESKPWHILRVKLKSAETKRDGFKVRAMA